MRKVHYAKTGFLMTACGIESEGRETTGDLDKVTCGGCQATDYFRRHDYDRVRIR